MDESMKLSSNAGLVSCVLHYRFITQTQISEN